MVENFLTRQLGDPELLRENGPTPDAAVGVEPAVCELEHLIPGNSGADGIVDARVSPDGFDGGFDDVLPEDLGDSGDPRVAAGASVVGPGCLHDREHMCSRKESGGGEW